MRTTIKRNEKLLLVSLMIVILALTFLIVLSTTPLPQIANASNSNFEIEQGQYDSYTDSRSFYYNNSLYEIRNYETNQTLRRANSSLSPIGNDTFNLSIAADNPIVQIIPKELFMNNGDFLYIGKEYGFFVNTQNYYPSQNKKSIVFVFEILTENTNLESNGGVVEVIVEPIFQREFVYLNSSVSQYYFKNNSSFAFYSIQNNDGYVVPQAMLNSNNQIDYDFEVKEFYLKDISYAMTLSNEQDPNFGYGDCYNPSNDTGSYITYFDYKYAGTGRRNGEFPTDETIELGGLAVDVGLKVGKKIAKNIPILGQIIEGVETVIEIVDGIKTVAHFAAGLNNYLTKDDVSINNGVITATNYYTNRDDQLGAYGQLMKTAAVLVNTSSEGDSIWYKVGNKATGYFQIGHSAVGLTPKNYTRMQREIALAVVRIDETVVAFEHSSYDFMLRTPVYKPVKMDKTEYLYLQNDGANYFRFTPEYASDYSIIFETQQNISLFINDTQINGTIIDGKTVFNAKLYADIGYDIAVFSSGDGCIAPFIISPQSSLTSISLDAGTEYLIKLSGGNNSIKRIAFSAPSIRVTNVHLLNGLYSLDVHDAFNNLVAPHSIDLMMKSNKDYYLVLSSDTDITTSIALSSISTIALNGQSSLNLEGGGGFKYVAFNSTSADTYVFSVANCHSEVNYYIYNQNGDLYSGGYFYGPRAYKLPIGTGLYYVGFQTTEDEDVAIVVKKANVSYSWEILKVESGAKTSIQKGTLATIDLHRANSTTTYELIFWINNSIKSTGYTIEGNTTNQGRGYSLAYSTGLFTLHNNCNVGTSMRIEADYFTDPDAVYKHKLELRVKFILSTAKLESTIDYKNKIEFQWTHQSEIQGYKFEILGQSYEIVNAGTGLNKKDIMSDLISKNATGIPELKMSYIKITNDGWVPVADDTKVKTSGNRTTLSINCMYSRYEKKTVLLIFTTHYYYVSNALQMYNIRHDMSYNRYMDTDINMSHYSSWTPIANLNCNIYGQDYKLTNLKITIPSYIGNEAYYGLVGINSGYISKLHIQGININSTGGSHNMAWVNAGGIAGYNAVGATIVDCSVTGTINVHHNNSRVGGLVGHNLGTIRKSNFGSFSEAQSLVNGNGDMAGIAGQSNGTVTYCNVYNARVHSYLVYTNRSSGGIVGYNYGGELSYCNVYAVEIAFTGYGNISASALRPNMGIIVGHIENSNLHYVGRENAGVNTGGLNSQQAANCANGPWGVYGVAINTDVQ